MTSSSKKSYFLKKFQQQPTHWNGVENNIVYLKAKKSSYKVERGSEEKEKGGGKIVGVLGVVVSIVTYIKFS